jgi:hypothetical protein
MPQGGPLGIISQMMKFLITVSICHWNGVSSPLSCKTVFQSTVTLFFGLSSFVINAVCLHRCLTQGLMSHCASCFCNRRAAIILLSGTPSSAPCRFTDGQWAAWGAFDSRRGQDTLTPHQWAQGSRRDADHHCHLARRLRMPGARSPLSHTSSWRLTKAHGQVYLSSPSHFLFKQ